MIISVMLIFLLFTDMYAEYEIVCPIGETILVEDIGTASATDTTHISCSQDRQMKYKKMCDGNTKCKITDKDCDLEWHCNVSYWQVVFKGVHDTPNGIYNLYKSKGSVPETMDDRHVFDDPLQITSNYRSPIVDIWETLHVYLILKNIKCHRNNVKLSIYKDGEEKSYFVFDGKGLSSEEWFSKNSLFRTSFTNFDTQEYPLEYLAIIKPKWNRTFYVSGKHDGCYNDKAWLIVKHGTLNCQYDQLNYKSYILLSPFKDKPVQFENYMNNPDAVLADFISISILRYGCHIPCERSIFSEKDLQTKIEKLTKETTIDRQQTSKYKRTKTSVHDGRRSAEVLGSTCAITILVLVVSIVILCDLPRIMNCFKMKKRHQRNVNPLPNCE